MKRICLLTGASGVFGTAFINRYAGEYSIAAIYHKNYVKYATQEQTFIDPLHPHLPLHDNEHAVYAIRADLTDEGTRSSVVRDVLRRFGQVDVLINAAVYRGWSQLVLQDVENAEAIWKLNILAPLRLSVALAKDHWAASPEANLKANRNIINLSSTAALFVYPDSGQALYASSKAALNHLTYHLASEFWDIGVRVNAVAPDTFPGRVPIDEVLEAVVGLDRSELTGKVVPLYRESD